MLMDMEGVRRGGEDDEKASSVVGSLGRMERKARAEEVVGMSLVWDWDGVVVTRPVMPVCTPCREGRHGVEPGPECSSDDFDCVCVCHSGEEV